MFQTKVPFTTLYSDGRHVIIMPYTIGQLATIYGVCKQTFNKWLKPYDHLIGERQGHFYTVKQVKIIFQSIDFPCLSEVDTPLATVEQSLVQVKNQPGNHHQKAA